MEARTGDGTKAKALAPRDRRLPLSLVEFIRPVAVPGAQYPLKKLVKGDKLPESNVDCPRLFLDPELQAVVVGERHFPLHLVFHYERAKTA